MLRAIQSHGADSDGAESRPGVRQGHAFLASDPGSEVDPLGSCQYMADFMIP